MKKKLTIIVSNFTELELYFGTIENSVQEEYSFLDHFIGIIKNDGNYILNEKGILELLEKECFVSRAKGAMLNFHDVYSFPKNLPIGYKAKFVMDLNEKLIEIQPLNSVRFIQED